MKFSNMVSSCSQVNMMKIKLTDILMYSGLKSARAVAGINGLSREIEKVSVYDRDSVDDFYGDEGVLYITSLPHLRKSGESALPWMKHLASGGACGLIVVEEALELIDDHTIEFCNNRGFPIVVIDNDVTYADIIEHVSILLYFNNLYLKKEEKVKQLLCDKLSDKEKLDLIYSMSPDMKPFVRGIAVQGTINSPLLQRELDHQLDVKEHIYTLLDEKRIVVVSAQRADGLDKKIQAVRAMMSPYFEHLTVGVGKTYGIAESDKAIANALTALKIAETRGTAYEMYDDLSDTAVLLSAKNTEEMRAFYKKFVQIIHDNDPAGKMEYTQCIRQYVQCRGEYTQAAKNMFQHESTLRYRINKVKSMLGLEEDTVRFHEVISMFIVIESILRD